MKKDSPRKHNQKLYWTFLCLEDKKDPLKKLKSQHAWTSNRLHHKRAFICVAFVFCTSSAFGPALSFTGFVTVSVDRLKGVIG